MKRTTVDVHTTEKYLTALHDNMLQVNTSLVTMESIVTMSSIAQCVSGQCGTMMLNQEVSILKWAQVNTRGGQCLYTCRDQSFKLVIVAACQDQQYNDDGDHLFSIQL